MVSNRITGSVQARSTTKPIGLDPAVVDYAVGLIHQVCYFAGSFYLVEEFRDQDLCRAIDRHDTAALFDRLMYDFSFQASARPRQRIRRPGVSTHPPHAS
jgi:hypothetical protein